MVAYGKILRYFRINPCMDENIRFYRGRFRSISLWYSVLWMFLGTSTILTPEKWSDLEYYGIIMLYLELKKCFAYWQSRGYEEDNE